MSSAPALRLRVVDARTLDDEVRATLRPGKTLRTRGGAERRLPCYFYEVPSWEVALDTLLSEHFSVWEFLNIDVRETVRLRTGWPRYLPCAVTLLAAHLELLRRELDTYVHIAANGGYRSPAHALSTHASTHCWGTAANIYRVGNDWLDDRATIVRYRKTIHQLLPGAWVRPFGGGAGRADDHLHLDLGYVTVTPHAAETDASEAEKENE